MTRPVAVVFSVLAALQILTGSTLLAEVVGPEKAALAGLAVGAATAGMAWYVQSQVTNKNQVAADKDPQTGQLRAGPASPAHITEGAPVILTETAGTGRADTLP